MAKNELRAIPTYGNITMHEWGQVASLLAEELGVRWPALSVVASESKCANIHIKGRFYSATVELGPKEPDAWEIVARIGSTSSPVGDIRCGRMNARELLSVCDACDHASGLMSDVLVWWRNCPCPYCSGRGWQRSKNDVCKDCAGTGVRPGEEGPANKAAPE